MAEKIIYDIIVDADGATKSVSKLNKETGKLDATFEDVYGDIKPLTGRLGELEDRMYELAQAGDTTSKEFKQLSDEASRLKTVQKDVDKQLDRTSRTLDEKFSTAVTVASSSMVLAEGAMSAMGVSAKTSEESMAVMVQTIAGAQALQSLNDATGIFSRLGSMIMKSTLFTKAATVAQRLWNVAMSANPIGAIVVAVTALIAAGYALITMFDKSTDAVKSFVNEIQGIDATNQALQRQSANRIKDLAKTHKKELDMMRAQNKSKEDIQAKELSQADEMLVALQKQKDDAQLRAQSTGEELDRAEAAYNKDRENETLKANFEAAEKAYDQAQGFYNKTEEAEKAHQDKINDIKFQAKLDAAIANRDVVVNTDDTEDEIIETVDEDDNILEDDSEIVALGEKYAQELLLEQMRVDNLIAEEQRLADEKERIQNESLMFAQALSGLFGQLGAQNKALATASIVLEKGAAIAGVIIEAQKANAQITSAKAAANLLIDAKYSPIPGGFAFATAEKAALSVRAAKNITKNNVMAGISVATIAASSLSSRPSLSGGGGGGGVSAPAAPTFNTVGQSPATVGSNQDSANSQIENSNNNPTRAYVVSTDISSQQALDRDIEDDNSLG